MARQGINTGSSPDAGDGDALLIGAIKINSNFNEVYTLLGDGTTLAPGIVTSIIAGTNVTVSGSTGQVTINASGSGGSSSQWVSTAAGIHTLSSVGIGTTNPTSALTVKGNTSLETLNVSGVSTFSDYVSVASTADFRINTGSGVEFKNSSGGALVKITSDGGSTAPRININSAYLQGNSSGDLDLWVPSGAEAITSVNSIEKFKVSGAGVTVTGTTFTNQLSVSGVSTFSGNVRVGVDTSSGVILTSPNGTQYRLIVDNAGTLSTVAV